MDRFNEASQQRQAWGSPFELFHNPFKGKSKYVFALIFPIKQRDRNTFSRHCLRNDTLDLSSAAAADDPSLSLVDHVTCLASHSRCENAPGTAEENL